MKNFLIVNVNNYVKSEYFVGYKELDNEDELMNYLNSNKLDKFNKSIEIDEELKIKVVSLFFNELKSIKHLVDDFNKDAPSEIIVFWENQLKKESLKRKENGFVNWDIHLTYDERVGNLKNLLTDYVKDYLKRKVVYGYLGHNLRKIYHDDVFSKIVEGSMKNILIVSLIYSNDNHKGTLKSTMNLCEKINERTVLIK